jgi:hypothetical protein
MHVFAGGFTALSVAPMRRMGLQGFVGAMHARCMGLTHTSALCQGAMHCIGMGLTDTSSLKLQGEVGGWRRLSGVHRCVSRKTHTHTFDKQARVSTSLHHCLCPRKGVTSLSPALQMIAM